MGAGKEKVMKRTDILPQHIPDGQQFDEESLKEVNEEIHKLAGKGFLSMFGSVAGCVALSIVSAKIIQGVVGYGLAAVIMIFMPAVMGLMMKISSKGYTDAAKRAGLSVRQLNEAIKNRNGNVAAWGELPADSAKLSPEEKKELKKIKRKKLLFVFGIVIAVIGVGLLGYDFYLTNTSNRSDYEITAVNGTVSEDDFKDIERILDDRFDVLKEKMKSDTKPPKYKLKDGSIICKNNSNILTEYNYQYFFVQGKISIVDDNGNELATDSDVEKAEYIDRKDGKAGTLALTFSEEAYEKIKAYDGVLRIKTGDKIFDKILLQNNNFASSWIIEHSVNSTCYFDEVAVGIYIAHEYPLPYEVDVSLQ